MYLLKRDGAQINGKRKQSRILLTAENQAHRPSNILSRKGRETPRPLHSKIEKVLVLPDSA